MPMSMWALSELHQLTFLLIPPMQDYVQLSVLEHNHLTSRGTRQDKPQAQPHKEIGNVEKIDRLKDSNLSFEAHYSLYHSVLAYTIPS